MRHEEVTGRIQETAALYALGALSQHEARSFENHLQDEGCPVCQAELERFEEVASSLALGTDEVAPPESIRERLEARIRSEAQTEARPEAPVPAAEFEPVPPPISYPESNRTSIWPWTLAASMVLAAGLAFWGWQTAQRENEELQQELAAARAETEKLIANMDRQQGLIDEMENVREALRSQGARVIFLAGQQPAPGATGAVIWDRDRNRWVLTGQLPPPPPGKIYQLWFITTSAPVSAGLLQTTPTGQSYVMVELPPDLQRINAAAITLEPEGGSNQPTMPIYALGAIG